jgi:hypothetical protein
VLGAAGEVRAGADDLSAIVDAAGKAGAITGSNPRSTIRPSSQRIEWLVPTEVTSLASTACPRAMTSRRTLVGPPSVTNGDDFLRLVGARPPIPGRRKRQLTTRTSRARRRGRRRYASFMAPLSPINLGIGEEDKVGPRRQPKSWQKQLGVGSVRRAYRARHGAPSPDPAGSCGAQRNALHTNSGKPVGNGLYKTSVLAVSSGAY